MRLMPELDEDEPIATTTRGVDFGPASRRSGHSVTP